jgi:predicted GNAT superfamily acetyltransferase
MRVRLLETRGPAWGAALDEIGLLLRRAENPAEKSALFPYHFLQVTLPRIGGGALFVEDAPPDDPARYTTVGVGFLFPRQPAENPRRAGRVYTLRYHPIPGHALPDHDALCRAASDALGAPVVFYAPAEAQHYAATHRSLGVVDVGRPGAEEAAAIPALHARIWGSPPEFLYPADIHSVDFAAGTSLVARLHGDREGEYGPPVGFLIGFYKFGGLPLPGDWAERFGGDFRLESQIMGVLPEQRGLRIANILKKVQAELAWREGIGMVNWTADPLLYANAALNFGLLRAVAFDFAPDLYPFRNALNRVPASRFGLTWLVGSARVLDAPLLGGRAAVVDLLHRPEIQIVNEGYERWLPGAWAERIAFEIPADWTALQQQDVAAAERWRAVTDALFAHYVGRDEGRYAVTGVGVAGERRFLLAERAGEELWRKLGAE